MKRGEIYYANLSPAIGSEMDKRRPVLVVSNDTNNRTATTVTILPLHLMLVVFTLTTLKKTYRLLTIL